MRLFAAALTIGLTSLLGSGCRHAGHPEPDSHRAEGQHGEQDAHHAHGPHEPGAHDAHGAHETGHHAGHGAHDAHAGHGVHDEHSGHGAQDEPGGAGRADSGHGHQTAHGDHASSRPGSEGAGHHANHHRFDDAAKWAKVFENEARNAWQKPEVVLSALALTDAMVVADIGAATGYFPVRIAARVPKGRVWGIDIEPAMVRFLNTRAQQDKLPNLFSVLGTAADPLLPEACDRIVVVNTYHHISDRVAYFGRLRSKLKPGGRLAIIDFKKKPLPFGPPMEMKLSAEAITAELVAAGYVPLPAEDVLPHQNLLQFTASP